MARKESGGWDRRWLGILMKIIEGQVRLAASDVGRTGSTTRSWTPSWPGPRRPTRSLAVTNPLVFINACRSAGEVPEYTRLMGWASQFMAAGAGAFAGTLWAVRSATACAFAEAFYDALLAGQALGHAARAARKATAADAADPTWLAYAVYGDPEATATVATAPPAAPGTTGVASAGH